MIGPLSLGGQNLKGLSSLLPGTSEAASLVDQYGNPVLGWAFGNVNLGDAVGFNWDPSSSTGADGNGNIFCSCVSFWMGTVQFMGDGAANPSVSLGSGAGSGTGGGAPSVTLNGTDTIGTITLTTGSSAPAANATIVSFTSGQSLSYSGHAFLQPRNAATAALTGNQAVNLSASKSGFSIVSGSTALAASTTYEWGYIFLGGQT
jgi:hypothetical protein